MPLSSLVFLVVVFLGLAVGTFGIGVVLIALNYLSTGDYDISRQLTLTEGAGDFLRNILLIVWTLAAILVGYFLGFKAHRKFKMDDLSSKRIQKAKAQIARDTDYVINELERDSKKRIEAAKARIAAREAKALQEAEEAQKRLAQRAIPRIPETVRRTEPPRRAHLTTKTPLPTPPNRGKTFFGAGAKNQFAPARKKGGAMWLRPFLCISCHRMVTCFIRQPLQP